MLSTQIQLALVLLLTGILLSVLGYRIRFRREWHLIAGFDLGHLRDPEGFGNWMGTIGLFLGSLTLGAAALAFTRPDLNPVLGTAYTAVVLASTAAVLLGAARYTL